MIPVTLIVGDVPSAVIEGVLENSRRCAVFTENPRPLRERFVEATAEWRLILLSEKENEDFFRFVRFAYTSRSVGPVLAKIEAALAYLGVPDSVIIFDEQFTSNVLDLALVKRRQLRQVVFRGLNGMILDQLRVIGYTQISRASVPGAEIEQLTSEFGNIVHPVAEDILGLFWSEFFCARV